MFGYIKPYKPELKQKDIHRYFGLYCALCNQLKRDYGISGRFLLNYDITFLLLYLNCCFSKDIHKYNIKCPYNPVKTRTVLCSNKALNYSAFINYWLATEKLLDDVNDGKNFFKLIIYKYLTSKKKYKVKKHIYFEKVTYLSETLQKIYADEKSAVNSFEFDNVTNAFGTFFSEIFRFKETKDKNSNKINMLLFQIGKWIYIIDAFDDYEKDVRKKRFNILFSLSESIPNDKELVFEKVLSLHIQLSNKINKLLSDLNEVIEDSIINNIITYGLNYVFYNIVQKKYKEYLWRIKQDGKYIFEPLDK